MVYVTGRWAILRSGHAPHPQHTGRCDAYRSIMAMARTECLVLLLLLLLPLPLLLPVLLLLQGVNAEGAAGPLCRYSTGLF